MLKMFFAYGILFGLLYRFLSVVKGLARGSSSAPFTLFHFAPRVTFITRVDVPVNSRNVGPNSGAEALERSVAQIGQSVKNGADGLAHGLVKAT